MRNNERIALQTPLEIHISEDISGKIIYTITYAGASLSAESIDKLFYTLKEKDKEQKEPTDEYTFDSERLRNALINLYTIGGKLNDENIRPNKLKVAEYSGTLPPPSKEMNIILQAGWFTSFRLFVLRVFRSIGYLAQLALGTTTHFFQFVFGPAWNFILTILGQSYILDIKYAYNEASRLSKEQHISFWDALCLNNYSLLIPLVNGIIWEPINLTSLILLGIPISVISRDEINHEDNLIGFGSDVPNDCVSLYTQKRKQDALNNQLSNAPRNNNGTVQSILKTGEIASKDLRYKLLKRFTLSVMIFIGMFLLYHAAPLAVGYLAHQFYFANTVWTSELAFKFYGSVTALIFGSVAGGFIARIKATDRPLEKFLIWLGIKKPLNVADSQEKEAIKLRVLENNDEQANLSSIETNSVSVLESRTKTLASITTAYSTDSNYSEVKEEEELDAVSIAGSISYVETPAHKSPSVKIDNTATSPQQPSTTASLKRRLSNISEDVLACPGTPMPALELFSSPSTPSNTSQPETDYPEPLILTGRPSSKLSEITQETGDGQIVTSSMETQHDISKPKDREIKSQPANTMLYRARSATIVKDGYDVCGLFGINVDDEGPTNSVIRTRSQTPDEGKMHSRRENLNLIPCSPPEKPRRLTVSPQTVSPTNAPQRVFHI